MPQPKWIQYGYMLAGAVNILGIPVFSKLFTNDYLTQVDPETFSYISLITIMLWGLAYISVARDVEKIPAISAVFAIEKFFYSGVWICWLRNNFSELSGIYRMDRITGFFFSIYGLNDFLFGIFFLYIFILIRRSETSRLHI